MIKVLLLSLFLTGCGAPILDAIKLTNPLTSDNKLALVISRYQYTTCKKTCLVKEREARDYINPDTDKPEVYFDCPLDYTEFICIDLYKQERRDRNQVYKFSPQEWQDFAAHLFGYYSHAHIKRGLTQLEFQCGQDFAVCEDHFEVIETLKRFFYERVDTK